jgi:multiple sugar transport system substrate-binding protein
MTRSFRIYATVATLSVLAACGSSAKTASTTAAAGSATTKAGGAATTAAAGGATTAAPAAGAKGDVAMWAYASSESEDAALKTLVDKYNGAGRAKVTLTIQAKYDEALQASLAGGQPPDVFYVNQDNFPGYVNKKILAPIGDKMVNPGDFYKGLADTFTADGKLYCPPKDFSTLALQYNVKAFAEAGIKPPTTWAELATAAEKLTKPNRPGLVVGAEFFRWGAFFQQAGGWLTDDKVTKMTVDSPEVKEAMTYLGDLSKKGFMQTASQVGAGWPGEALGKEQAAMVIEGNWIIGFMAKTFPAVEYKSVELPAGPKGKGSLSYTVCYGVAAASKNVAGATDFVSWMTAPEQMLSFTKDFPVMPSRTSVTADWIKSHPEAQAYVDGAAYARKPVFKDGFKAVLDTLNENIQGIAAGKKTVDEAIKATSTAGKDVLG